VVLGPGLALALIVTGDETVLPETGLVICTEIADERTEKPQMNMSANNRLSFFKKGLLEFVIGLGADLDEGALMHLQGGVAPCARRRFWLCQRE
jgi:hypothetical protein